jgi:hypothetical protein
MPAELVEQLKNIQKWALGNRRQARREAVLFWSLKIPIIVASAGYGVAIKFGWENGLAIAGLLAAGCTMIDGFYQPGTLRNFHHKAYFELMSLADDIVAQWQVGKLSKKNKGSLAAKLIGEAQMRKNQIAAYLVEAEQTLGKDPSKK